GDHPVVSRLELPPLEAEAARKLAQACASTALGADELRRLEEDAGGNPFLIVELARASSELGRDALPSVAELLAARLGRVGPEARTLVEVAAVAGHLVPFALLAGAAALEPAAAADALDE